jgi:hypothetical protein
MTSLAPKPRPVVLYAPPRIPERAGDIIQRLQDRIAQDGLVSKARPVVRPFRNRNLPKDSIVCCDGLDRMVLGTIGDAIRLLYRLVVERGCEVWIYDDNGSRLVIDQGWRDQLQVLGHDLFRAHRSRMIRSGVGMARLAGACVGRPHLSSDVEKAVLETIEKERSIRATEKTLRSQGVQVSRSTISRLLKKVRSA